jgi:hypothetical protein
LGGTQATGAATQADWGICRANQRDESSIGLSSFASLAQGGLMLHHRLAWLCLSGNPIHQLLEDIKESLKPDIILIDACTGFTDMGAIALFDQADLGIICFSPTRQSYAGLKWVVKAASKQRKYNGIPDLRFLLTPMPPVALTQEQAWSDQAADWITEYWGLPADITVDELFYHVPYNPGITTRENLFEEVPMAILASYEPVAEVIRASLPERTSNSVAASEVDFLHIVKGRVLLKQQKQVYSQGDRKERVECARCRSLWTTVFYI